MTDGIESVHFVMFSYRLFFLSTKLAFCETPDRAPVDQNNVHNYVNNSYSDKRTAWIYQS